MPRGDEVTAAEMESLLAELASAGGSLHAPARPYAATTAQGTTGSTNILREQHRSATCGTASGSGPRRLSAAAAPKRAEAVGFSSYASTGMTDGELRSERHTITPLGVRLAPLGPAPRPHSGSTTTTTAAAAAAGLSPHSPLRGGLAPLPPLASGAGGGSVAAPAPQPFPRGESLTGAETGAGEATGPVEADTSAHRAANFLPILCVRYLNPAGLSPPARWGHTLTAMGGSASTSALYTFGGVELSGRETNTLAVFDTSAIVWEPAPVGGGVGGGPAPAPRYGHAACAFEDRYLVIHGGAASNASTLFGDIHLYDTQTHTWRCVWPGLSSSGDTGGGISSSANSSNEPAPRFGHSIVVYDDRLYVFGGRVLRPSSGGSESRSATTTVASADVYVFSLNSLRWRRRIRAPAGGRRGSGVGVTPDGDGATPSDHESASPCGRAHHAAAVNGSLLYINGGVDAHGTVLGDTWMLNLAGGSTISPSAHTTSTSPEAASVASPTWRCLHRGGSADAIPRERHSLFACGEAILVVGGCSPSAFGGGVADKFTNFVSVLPTVGPGAGACWIPVATGNAAIVAPSKKNFAAAFTGGFVYVFGGMSGTTTATNTMIRFLAADGYVAADARATSLANDEALRGLMRQLRECPPIPFDTIVVAGVASRDPELAAREGVSERGAGGGGLLISTIIGTADREVHLHRVILQQRAPALLAALQSCRTETVVRPLAAAGSSPWKQPQRPTVNAQVDGGDVVDALLSQRAGGHTNTTTTTARTTADGTLSSPAVGGQVVRYDTVGNNRVAGLAHPLTAEELSCLADYLYWGGLPAAFKRLLRDEVAAGAGADGKGEADAGGTGAAKAGAHGRAVREHLRATLETLRGAARDFQLAPLMELAEALLAGSRAQLQAAQAASIAALREDMAALLRSGAGATCTVLFVDPHTKQQTAHALHPAVLMAASHFFSDLLRPLVTGERTNYQVGAVASKLTAVSSGTTGAAGGEGVGSGPLLFSGSATLSKRTILMGPVAVPKLAVPWMLRYLYTQQLHVPREVAMEVMLGAHQLGLPLLQAYSEAIVARDSVNYDSCCSYYFLAKKHGAALLEETCLLTAVMGYAEVRMQRSYRDLSEEDRKSIDAVAQELGAASWVPPPQPTNELKPSETYAARWKAASL